MKLLEAIAARGMTPPHHVTPGRWQRFPGVGKGKANRSGWLRVISPTLAIFGDWSSGLSEVWRDDSHTGDVDTAALLKQARIRERQYQQQQERQQAKVAAEAAELVRGAVLSGHPYLEAKGFKERTCLVRDGKLVIAVRDAIDYRQIISAQLIDETGEKRFLTGGRTRNGIHRLGVAPERARRVVFCEGYATGLSIDAALRKLPGSHCVVVCFSARNLETVVKSTGLRGLVCADNDASLTGEESAKRTGLPWVMPPQVGTDFNDLHRAAGLHAVVEVLRPH